MSASARDVHTIVRDTVLRLLHRDLTAAQREVEAYPDDAALWRVVPGIGNSGGTLAMHLAGNLRHFIGATLGATGYARDRDAEFSVRGISRAEVSRHLNDAMTQVTNTLRVLDPSTLDAVYPITVGTALTVRTDVYFVHLVAHASYHLGQIDYHRRIVTGNGATMETVSLSALLGPLPDVADRTSDV